MTRSLGSLASTTCLAAGLVGLFTPLQAQPAPAVPARSALGVRVFNVREQGAQGNGETLDTEALNRAVEACAAAGGGQVLFPAGRYLSGTVRLRSHVALVLEAGATLVGTTNLTRYQQPSLPDFMPEAKWGKWHRALVLGEGVEDVSITGQGTIDGNRVFDPTGEEHMRGPHAIVLVNCRGVTFRDISILDAANYAMFLQVTDQVEVRNVKFTGGWDGVHFRGAPDHPCRDINILGCQFYTGDDSIAGRYWDRVVISGCVVNSSCNGIRLIGPATRLTIQDCLFYGPGLRPHRSSARTNMLSGIILQPGAWDATRGLLDDVLIDNVTMHHVAAPVDIWLKKGNTAGRITVSRLSATAVYRAAMSVENWSDTPLTNVVFRAVNVEFDGGGTAAQADRTVKSPGVDSRPLPAWGLYARNVEGLTLEDVRFTCTQDDFRPVLVAEGVQRLSLDHFKFTQVPGVTEPIRLTNVVQMRVRETELGAAGPGSGWQKRAN